HPPPPPVPRAGGEPGAPPPSAPAAPDDWPRRRLELGLALRPLRVRKPSRDRMVIEEEATARRAAEEHRWEPVMRAELVRWPDLALVVDGTPSMEVWHHLLPELPLPMERLRGVRR